jgi:hypothetical protein
MRKGLSGSVSQAQQISTAVTRLSLSLSLLYSEVSGWNSRQVPTILIEVCRDFSPSLQENVVTITQNTPRPITPYSFSFCHVFKHHGKNLGPDGQTGL